MEYFNVSLEAGLSHFIKALFHFVYSLQFLASFFLFYFIDERVKSII